MSAPPTRAASDHAAARFVRRRLARGVPYGLATTLAFAFVVAAVAGFLGLIGLATSPDDVARFDQTAHDTLFNALGASRQLGLAVTWFGNNATVIGLVVATALALVVTKRYWAAFRVVFASGIGGLVVRGLKLVFARDRPMDQVVEAAGYSFPSGHAFASTVFYGMLIYLAFRLTERTWARTLAVVVGVAVIGAVGLSRIYLNVHYPTDVVGGWLAGSAWLVSSLLLVDVVETRTRSRREAAEETTRPDDADPRPPHAPTRTAGGPRA